MTMTPTNAETLKQRFPTASEIPQEHRLASPIHRRTCLVGGELRELHQHRLHTLRRTMDFQHHAPFVATLGPRSGLRDFSGHQLP